MAEQKNDTDVRFWTSRKFWIVVLLCQVLLVLALTDTVRFTPQQIIDFVEWIVAWALGAHAATDITSLIVSRKNGAKGP